MKTRFCIYYCPYCGNLDIFDCGDTFACSQCTYDFKWKKKLYHQPLEFDKRVFDLIEDKENVISVQESLALRKVFEGFQKKRTIVLRFKAIFKRILNYSKI